MLMGRRDMLIILPSKCRDGLGSESETRQVKPSKGGGELCETFYSW